MISANQIKKGSTIILNDELYNVIDTQHVKPGKGGAFIIAKVKKKSDGSIVSKTLRAQDKIKLAFISDKKMQYLYHKGSTYYFMDMETYDQKPVGENYIKDIKDFLKDNMEVTCYFYNNEIIDLKIPTFLKLEVKDTQPGIRGNTAQGGGGTKPAQLETGIEIQVPLFINKGDKVKIDTRTAEYVERAK